VVRRENTPFVPQGVPPQSLPQRCQKPFGASAPSVVARRPARFGGGHFRPGIAIDPAIDAAVRTYCNRRFPGSSLAWIRPMTPQEFITKWKRANLSERSACQQHFLDLCDVARPAQARRGRSRRAPPTPSNAASPRPPAAAAGPSAGPRGVVSTRVYLIAIPHFFRVFSRCFLEANPTSAGYRKRGSHKRD